ncbi:MAG: hypothetical protein R3E50_07125 [Halioglobus sp.]
MVITGSFVGALAEFKQSGDGAALPLATSRDVGRRNRNPGK